MPARAGARGSGSASASAEAWTRMIVVARSPLVLIGTFTGVNAQRQPSGVRQAYRICFALADLKAGRLVSKGLAFSLPDGVDSTPLAAV